ncbi:MAG: DNA helicase [Betaproteobacteria bacterium]|nr:DNA helicase [Betaproteobacteria bacterium]
MGEALRATEESVASMIGASFSGAAPAVSSASEPYEGEKFAFDAGFQTKIAALTLRDNQFMRRMSHVVRPEFFESAGEAALVNIALRHHQRYGVVPDPASLVTAIRDDVTAKVIRKDVAPLVVAARKEIFAADLGNARFVEDKVVAFARHQALGEALVKCVDLREKGQFEKAETVVKAAIEIGANDDGDAYDYAERIKERTENRLERASGIRPPQGITTGVPKMDEILYHRGWGRRELTTIMGGAKMGKSTALVGFAKSAWLARKNVLFVTLEVGANIVADRLDASIAEVMMKELDKRPHEVAEKIQEIFDRKVGKFVMHEYPSGTLTPNMLRTLLDRYKSPGRNDDGSVRPPIDFDLVVVDYADIMAPNHRYNDPIENSKSIYVDLRAIAFDYNVAMLTATQTNRTGYTATVAKAEHVAEDFNKVRTVDLMISINRTDEEAMRDEARLYFAASRNQESGFTIVVRQNLAMMQFITTVLRIE